MWTGSVLMDRQVESGTGRQVNNRTGRYVDSKAKTDRQKEVDRKTGIEVKKWTGEWEGSKMARAWTCGQVDRSSS